MKKKGALIGLLLGVVILVGMACARAEPTPTPTATPRPAATPTPTITPTPAVAGPRRGGVLRVPLPVQTPHFDTHQSVVQDQTVNSNANNHLIQLNRADISRIDPDLAKSWQVSQDGTTITFNLRDNVLFHDGQELACDDVQYSFQRIKDPPTGMVSPRKGQYKAITSIECPDPLTVVFNLGHPWADALLNIADPFAIIYPKHVVQAKDQAGEFMKNTIIGTGPFKFKRHVQAEVTELVRFPDYWDEPMPFLDGLEFFWLPTEYTRWLAALQGGRVDYITSLDSPQIVKQAEEQNKGEYTVKRGKRVIFVNYIPDQHPGSVWQDIELRKAAALALVQGEFRESMCDLAFVCWESGPLPPESQFGIPLEQLRQIPGYGLDAEARRAQAREILSRKDVPPFKVFSRNDIPAFRDSAVVVCDLLLKVGFECVFEGMEQGPYYDMVNNRRIPTGDTVLHSIAIANATPDAILGQSYHPDGIRNYGDYQNQELVDLFSEQSRELNLDRRKELLLEYQEMFLKTYAHVILGWRGGAKVFWNNVHGSLTNWTEQAVYWPARYDDAWIEQ